LRVDVVAEGLAFCVENHGAIIRGHVLVELPQHVEHAVDRSRRLSFRVPKLRQRVERAIEIRRSVDQQKSFHGVPR
jgi:hypothetical protein